MPMRVRLHVPCEIAGRLYQTGEIAVLPDGVPGPHRAARAVDTGAPVDEPLFTELPPEDPPEDPPADPEPEPAAADAADVPRNMSSALFNGA